MVLGKYSHATMRKEDTNLAMKHVNCNSDLLITSTGVVVTPSEIILPATF